MKMNGYPIPSNLRRRLEGAIDGVRGSQKIAGGVCSTLFGVLIVGDDYAGDGKPGHVLELHMAVRRGSNLIKKTEQQYLKLQPLAYIPINIISAVVTPCLAIIALGALWGAQRANLRWR